MHFEQAVAFACDGGRINAMKLAYRCRVCQEFGSNQRVIIKSYFYRNIDSRYKFLVLIHPVSCRRILSIKR